MHFAIVNSRQIAGSFTCASRNSYRETGRDNRERSLRGPGPECNCSNISRSTTRHSFILIKLLMLLSSITKPSIPKATNAVRSKGGDLPAPVQHAVILDVVQVEII